MKHYPEGIYTCVHGYTHGNMGRIFTKGNTYRLSYEKPRVLDCDYVLVGNKHPIRISPEGFEELFDVEHPVKITVYKLVKLRKNGNCYPLFIGKKKPFVMNQEMQCEFLPTKGFAPRSVDDANTGGWHCCFFPVAPHLSEKLATGEQRVWLRCDGAGKMTTYKRGLHQGGDWILVEKLTPREILTSEQVAALKAEFDALHAEK